VHPVVVGSGDCRGEIRIESVDGEHEQTAARIENRHVETFFVHGAKLSDVVKSRASSSAYFSLSIRSRIGLSSGFGLASAAA
jgi:mevalonate kinase